MTVTELRRARAKLGMTQQALADKVGRNISTYRRWETDATKRSSIAVPSWAAREINRIIKESKA